MRVIAMMRAALILVLLAPAALAQTPTVGSLQAQNALRELAPVIGTARSNLGLGGCQVFTSSGTWTKNGVASTVYVFLLGSGGAGGNGTQGTAGIDIPGGAGGGGGAGRKFIVPASVLSATEPVTIGAGGQPGAAGSTLGGNGDSTSFGPLSVGGGGGGAAADNSGGDTQGGGGGSPIASPTGNAIGYIAGMGALNGLNGYTASTALPGTFYGLGAPGAGSHVGRAGLITLYGIGGGGGGASGGGVSAANVTQNGGSALLVVSSPTPLSQGGVAPGGNASAATYSYIPGAGSLGGAGGAGGITSGGNGGAGQPGSGGGGGGSAQSAAYGFGGAGGDGEVVVCQW